MTRNAAAEDREKLAGRLARPIQGLPRSQKARDEQFAQFKRAMAERSEVG